MLYAVDELREDLREDMRVERATGAAESAGAPPAAAKRVEAVAEQDAAELREPIRDMFYDGAVSRGPCLFARKPKLRALYTEQPTAHPYEHVLGRRDERKTLAQREAEWLFWPPKRTGGLLADLVHEEEEGAPRQLGPMSDRERAKLADAQTPVRIDRHSMRTDLLTTMLTRREATRREPSRIVASRLRPDTGGSPHLAAALPTSTLEWSASSPTLPAQHLAASPSRSKAARASSASGMLRETAGSHGTSASPALASGPALTLEAGLRADEMSAATAFNHRHGERIKGAASFLATPPFPSMRTGLQFALSLEEVRRNRYVVAESYDPYDHTAPAAAPSRVGGRQLAVPRSWTLEDSVWHPRKVHGNSRDYYETEPAREAMFAIDFAFVRRAPGLMQKIESLAAVSARVDDTSGKPKDGNQRGGSAAAGNSGGNDGGTRGVSKGRSQIEAVREALWRHSELIYGTYDFYCARMMDASDRRANAHGEYESAFSMSASAYKAFGRESGVLEIVGPLRFDVVWHQVNAPLKGDDSRYNTKQLLTRHEFVQAVVRLAIVAFIETDGAELPRRRGVQSMAATAIDMLCDDHIAANCPPEVHLDVNAFRRLRCYQEPVDRVLQAHGHALKRLFNVYAFTNRDDLDELQRKKMLSVGEWVRFLRHVSLLDTTPVTSHLSLEEAVLIFKWSLIRGGASKDYTPACIALQRNMFYEDFLVRAARAALERKPQRKSCAPESLLPCPAPREMPRSETTPSA